VTEMDLATRLGVSRTPVRQAISRLVVEGLLTSEPHSGLSVTSLDYQQGMELYAIREVLEGTAARWAAQHASSTELAAMAEIVESEPALFDKPQQLLEANRRLHTTIFLAAHNRFLLRSLMQLHVTMALLPSLLAERGRAQEAHHEHLALLAALRARDGEQAESIARQHIRASQQHRVTTLVEKAVVEMGQPGAPNLDLREESVGN
ncbi:MAG TPA: GntR family transcriptional regulator, partial [Candidatus Saccharimonadales bacterium]|nr:GntR family transcriptional regulator [Candidatus Saccharimonadales bacterium]